VEKIGSLGTQANNPGRQNFFLKIWGSSALSIFIDRVGDVQRHRWRCCARMLPDFARIAARERMISAAKPKSVVSEQSGELQFLGRMQIVS
jgi:hypothetical protein